jgi:nitrite reductase (NADH) small subunit
MTTTTTEWVKVGRLADIPKLGSRVVRRAGGDIALFRTNDDSVYALKNKCPHKGGPLSDGIVHGCRVTCPLHNWVLELKSGEAVAPDVGHARTYPVKVEGGAVFVQL